MNDSIRICTQASYKNGEQQYLVFDSVTEFTPSHTKKLTQYATSDNSSISNHSVLSNPTISMRGRVSAYSMTPHRNNMLKQDDTRTSSAHDILNKWFLTHEDLFIDAGYRGFSQYTLTSFSPIEDGTESLIFDLKFEKVRRVTYDKITLVQHMSDDLALDAAANSTKGGGSGNNTSNERTNQVIHTANSTTFDNPEKEALKNSIMSDYS